MEKVIEIKESGEMYLETILLLKKQKTEVHSVDIVEYLGYTKSSVSRGVGILRKLKLIYVNDAGALEFTEEGERRANEIFERHKMLTEFLMALQVPLEVAEKDACKMEHVISNITVEKIKKFIEKQ